MICLSRRTTGTFFICISAFLYGVRYLSAAIFGSNLSSWSSELFNAMMDYVGKGPKNLSILALIIGIIYLIWAELERDSKYLKKIFNNLKKIFNNLNNEYSYKENEEQKNTMKE
jgi:hypothetical protein